MITTLIHSSSRCCFMAAALTATYILSVILFPVRSVTALASASTTPKILLCDAPSSVLSLLRDRSCKLELLQGITDDELASRLKEGDIDAFVIRSANTASSEWIRSTIAPQTTSRVRVIARAGVGLDNIDCDTCRELQIPVVTAAGANAVAVAEHALALLLALARKIKPATASVAQGRWDKPDLTGVGLRGKTLGIVGFGAIGWELAKIGSAVGMSIVIAPPTKATTLSQEQEALRKTKLASVAEDAKQASTLQELLETADFVSVQLPLTETTRGYIGRNELERMKPNARLVSVGRGGVVDEAALLDCLERNCIAGAALDVFESEGPDRIGTDEVLAKLAALNSTVITPHVGGHTEEAQLDVWSCVVDNVLKALQTSNMESIVP